MRRNCGLEAGCSPGRLGFRPQTLRKRPSLVLNCFRSARVFSSGAVEGMRGKVRVVLGKAYGFRS
ncbi:MAG: transposase [Bryobacterales bacterium]|nr:transposase [Bryobacterales bacterium]